MRLGERQRQVLSTLIRLYVSTGHPVASKAVVEQFPEALSPATIRNVMAELEVAGLLFQPHTSAGRVPTNKAYRVYVDSILGTARLSPSLGRHIEDVLVAGPTDPEQLMSRASRVLSEASDNIGLVLGPKLEEKLLEHIQFVKLPGERVLAVIVSRPDLVENKVVPLDEDIPQAELERAAHFLNTEFRGWSLQTIRLEFFKRLEEEQARYSRLLQTVATLLLWGALASEDPGPVFVEGTARILDRPEFGDVYRVKELLAALEEKARLVKIISSCLRASSSGVGVVIGQENPDHAIRHCSFVVAPLRYRERVVGALGVVGPTRMEYDRAITTVDYVAHLCSRLLSCN